MHSQPSKSIFLVRTICFLERRYVVLPWVATPPGFSRGAPVSREVSDLRSARRRQCHFRLPYDRLDQIRRRHDFGSGAPGTGGYQVDGFTGQHGRYRRVVVGRSPFVRVPGQWRVKSRRGNHRLKNAMFLAAFGSLLSARVQSVLRPQEGRRKAPQRCDHLPRPPALQRHPGHARHAPVLQPSPPNQRTD
jgi:hypothetical protein